MSNEFEHVFSRMADRASGVQKRNPRPLSTADLRIIAALVDWNTVEELAKALDMEPHGLASNLLRLLERGVVQRRHRLFEWRRL